MVALLLALADAGIPVQTDSVPEPLLKKLQPGKISGFLCLGNVGSAVVRTLKRIATDMRFVAGDAEDESHLPLAQIVELEGVRVGMTHGHMIMPRGNDMALDAERRRVNVDVLLSASTGRASTRQHGSGLLVDPGSITGLRCSPLASRKPSFTLLSLDNGKVTTFTYSIDENGTVAFQRRDFQRQQHGVVTRPQAAAATAAAPAQAPQAQPDQPPPPAAAAPAAPAQPPAATAEAAEDSAEAATVDNMPGTSAQDDAPADVDTAAEPEQEASPAGADSEAAETPGADDEAAAPALLAEEPSAASETALPE